MHAFVAYGGTFDPVHCGHQAVAHAVADTLGCDVSLVPAADPPHKSVTHAPGMHRLRMLELVVAGDRRLHIDTRELGRDGPSYSIDTLQELRASLGSRIPIIWVIGADSLEQLHRWHRWQELFDQAHVLAVGRPGHALDAAGLASLPEHLAAGLHGRWREPRELLGCPAGSIAVLPLEPPRPESSTAIRAAIAADTPWQPSVPEAVAAYITRHRLYAPVATA
ncbi:MAG: nicotinate-nucleotide adenylyltransferase [Lysobacter sp.]|nr:MAG: nicotinate-nucleotide adenylyltransferase [Lysobacter sp.]